MLLEAEGTAGYITIDTGSFFLKDRARLSATNFGVGDAGAIKITAMDAISLEGESSQGLDSDIFRVVDRGAQR